MANQRRSWEGRGKEFAAQATDGALAKLEEEIQEKQARLDQLDEELRATSVALRLTERSQLAQEIQRLHSELSFARDEVKPEMVGAAGRAGRRRDPSKGCMGGG